MDLEHDLPGVADLIVLNRFVRGLPFDELRPAPELVAGSFEAGHRPLALRGPSGRHAGLFPGRRRGGRCRSTASATWFDPRTGERRPAAGTGGLLHRAGRDRRRRASARLRPGGGGGAEARERAHHRAVPARDRRRSAAGGGGDCRGAVLRHVPRHPRGDCRGQGAGRGADRAAGGGRGHRRAVAARRGRQFGRALPALRDDAELAAGDDRAVAAEPRGDGRGQSLRAEAGLGPAHPRHRAARGVLRDAIRGRGSGSMARAGSAASTGGR